MTSPAAAADRRPARSLLWLPHVLLLASWVIAAAAAAAQAGGVERTVLLRAGLLLVAASGWTTFALPRALGGARGWPLAYFAVRIVLTALLLACSPWFGVYAWYAYLEAVRLFPGRRALLAVAVTAPVTTAGYLGGYPHTWSGVGLWVPLSAASWVLVACFAVSAQRGAAEGDERERALAALTEANHRLEAAAAENQALALRVAEQARAAGAEQERTRLAGEIHDTLAQALAGILRQLEAAARVGELSGEHHHVRQATALAADGLSEARRSLQALRPAALEGVRLPEAVGDVSRRWSRRSGLPVACEVSGQVVALGTEAEIALLRAVQEGLVNVEKHASAGRVGVTLTYLADEVVLDVRDDGAGFVPGAGSRAGGGVGLAAMRERLRRVGGDLVVETAPGQGTALAASVPVLTRSPRDARVDA